MRTAQKVAKKTAASSGTFSDDERAAMKERAREVKSARSRGSKADGEGEVLAKIATMKPADRAMAERVHALVKAAAPMLTATTWYGMPAYARDDGKVVCFFKDAAKFKARYATLGFSDKAHLDDGGIWPTDFALKDLTPAAEARITALVKKAVG
jgi:uncharacterized protein YdhG (YjbR/CyaY superfamily)